MAKSQFPPFRRETIEFMAEALWRFDNRKDLVTSDVMSEELRMSPDFAPHVALVAVTLTAVKEFSEDADKVQ